jgi:multimeric flavodoxin WrbA
MNETGQQAIIFAASHRAGGNSDHAAMLLAEGVAQAGGSARIVALRKYHVLPCLACHACAKDEQSRCVLRDRDQAEELFSLVLEAPLVLFASPIYFYALPSRLKTWIDRGQRFWEARRKGDAWSLALPERKAHACLVAGQPSGQKLFEGARLTLKYFLMNFGYTLEAPLELRAQDALGDLHNDHAAAQSVLAQGRTAWLTRQGMA